MRKLFLSSMLALSLVPAAGRAQVGVHIDIGLPAVPPLVEVQPGIRVVAGFPEEVFYRDGWYWCRRGGAWYRARTPGAPFMWVEPRRVPVALVHIPPGQYRNWHRGEVARWHGEREHDRAMHEERREEHEHR